MEHHVSALCTQYNVITHTPPPFLVSLIFVFGLLFTRDIPNGIGKPPGVH